MIWALRKGDRVVAFLSPRADYAYLFRALAELGGVFVPLNPQLRPRSMSQVLQDADPLMLVTERPLDEDSFTHPAGLKHVLHAPGAGDLNPTLGELAVSGKTDPLPPVDVSPEDLLALLYTSGTTGQLKGTMHSYRGLLTPVVARMKSIIMR